MSRSQYFSSLNEKAKPKPKPNLGIRGRRKTKFKKSRKQRKNKSSKMKRPKFYGGEYIVITSFTCPYCSYYNPSFKLTDNYKGFTVIYNTSSEKYKCSYCMRIFECGDGPPSRDDYGKYVFNNIIKENCNVLNEGASNIYRGPKS